MKKREFEAIRIPAAVSLFILNSFLKLLSNYKFHHFLPDLNEIHTIGKA